MNIIFHIPNYIDPNLPSGSQIRPMKMLQSFKDLGFNVDVVMGYVVDRKKQIIDIKQKIKNGIKYEFLYSESSTMPTALTEKHHLPVAPFLDFNFFKFCRSNNIKVSLFYRDIHWRFSHSKSNSSFLKRFIALLFYRFDLFMYKNTIDVLYLPSLKMYDYIPLNFKKEIYSLPPGIISRQQISDKQDSKLRFIYVGGIGELYDVKLFLKVIRQFRNIEFKLCIRSIDWGKVKLEYDEYMHKDYIYHTSGSGLDELYRASDIAVLFLKPSVYWSFVMPVKLFDYISYKKPIIAVKGTCVADFVEKNNIGWVINYSENELENLIQFLNENPIEIVNKRNNIQGIIKSNTWIARAEEVVSRFSLKD